MFLMVIIVIVVVMVMVMVIVVVIVVVIMLWSAFLDLLNPGGRGGDRFVVKGTGVDDAVKIDVGIVAADNLCPGLQGTNDGLYTSQFVGCHLGGFVEEYLVAEFNLLYEQVLDVVLLKVFLFQVIATAKLALHPHGIDHGDNAIEARNALHHIFVTHRGYGADGTGNGLGFADAAGLDDDVVETLHLHDVAQLFDEVHLQRAADAAVLERHEAFILLSHNAPFLYEVGIDVHLTDIVHDDGKADAAFVRQDTIDEGCFSAAKITR